MANTGAPNGGYGPGKPSPYWNAQAEPEIDVWDPKAATNSASWNQQQQNSQQHWQSTAASTVPQYQTNAPQYGQGDIDSNWRNQMNVPPINPQVSLGNPNAPAADIYQQASGYSGQMMNLAPSTYPQYDPSQSSNQQMQYYGGPPTNPPPQMYPNDGTWNSGYNSPTPPQTSNSSSQSQYQSYASDRNMGKHQHDLQSNNDSFYTVKPFKNPLMENESNDAEDPANLVRNLHIEGQKAQQQMQNNISYPKVLSNASLAMLRKDLEFAAVAFQSPEALKRAREMELGLRSVDDVGADVMVSSLSVEAPNFVPRFSSAVKREPTLAPKAEEELVVANLKTFINNVLTHPGSFDNLSAVYVNQVKNFLHSDETVKEIVEIIFTKAINEDNFKYLGARLCESLTMPNVLRNFRSIFLTHFQAEFKKIRGLLDQNEDNFKKDAVKDAGKAQDEKDAEKVPDEKVAENIKGVKVAEETQDEKDAEKIEGFIMFMAEIFLHIKINGAPFTSLGRSLSKSLEKLLSVPTFRKVNFVCKLLKLTGAKLLDAFEKDETDMVNYQKAFTVLNEFSQKQQGKTDEDCKRTMLLISSVSRLKELNWGRTMSNTRRKSSIDNPEQFGEELSEVDQNYYMNEPVFFTPDGVQYTAAEAQIPEFYEKHLAKFNLKTGVVTDDSKSFPWSEYDGGGFDDLVPSDEEVEFYREDLGDSEYSAEFEKFLAESQQL